MGSFSTATCLLSFGDENSVSCSNVKRVYYSLQEIIKVSHSNLSVLSNTVTKTARAEVHTIQFPSMEADIRTLAMRITA